MPFEKLLLTLASSILQNCLLLNIQCGCGETILPQLLSNIIVWDSKIEEDETVVVFNAKLKGIEDQDYQLGNKYLDGKLVRKTLTSLEDLMQM